MNLFPEDILRLLIAMALGGALGAERELRDKAAGLRTLMFICAGSALFTMFSTRLAQASGADTTRITAQIVTGIGFVGAGVILREHGEIHGLTTAATIWLTAALGVGVGGGLIIFSIIAAAILLLAMLAFPYLEAGMNSFRQVRVYQITSSLDKKTFQALRDDFLHHGLQITGSHRSRRGSMQTIRITAAGRVKSHEALIEDLLGDSDIEEFDV